MSNVDWDALPELLPRSVVLRITGWSKQGYYLALREVRALSTRPPGYKQSRVRKTILQQYIQG